LQVGEFQTKPGCWVHEGVAGRVRNDQVHGV
jgi:hypothetical protein